MSQEASKKIENMGVKEIAEYLNIPIWLVQTIMCNYVESVPISGGASCFATDIYNEWKPVKIAILNSLPLNAFDRPYDLKVFPVTSTKRLLEFLTSVPNEYTCFVRHPATVGVINKYLNVRCGGETYRYNGEIIVAFVLRSRTPTSGTEVNNITEDDLLSYIIYPMPILDS